MSAPVPTEHHAVIVKLSPLTVVHVSNAACLSRSFLIASSLVLFSEYCFQYDIFCVVIGRVTFAGSDSFKVICERVCHYECFA